MNGKATWKLGIGEIRGVYSTWYKPPAAMGQCADASWIIACEHETQSFMKNGGQQKCLDKYIYIYIYINNYYYLLRGSFFWMFLYAYLEWDDFMGSCSLSCWHEIFILGLHGKLLSLLGKIPFA